MHPVLVSSLPKKENSGILNRHLLMLAFITELRVTQSALKKRISFTRMRMLSGGNWVAELQQLLVLAKSKAYVCNKRMSC